MELKVQLNIELRQDNGKRKGMCERLILQCKHCNTVIKTFDTSNAITDEVNRNSNRKTQIRDINLRSVVATTSAGGGLSSYVGSTVILIFQNLLPTNRTVIYSAMLMKKRRKTLNVVCPKLHMNLEN